MTAATVADPAGALCAYLAATIPDVLDTNPQTGGPALFRPTLPEWVDASMAALACIVVRPSGGYKLFANGLLPVADPTLDLTCYAGSQQQSYVVATTATRALKQLTQSMWGGAILYWATISAGPLMLPDTDTFWPATWLSAQVMHSEVADAS